MTQANRVFISQNEDLIRRLPQVYAAVLPTILAQGADTEQSIQDLTVGLLRLSPLIIDNLGFQVRLGDANTAYAQAIGKTVEELTALERQTALVNEVMRAAVANNQNLGDISNQTALAANQLTQAWERFKLSLGRGFEEDIQRDTQTLTTLLNLVTDFIDLLQTPFGDYFKQGKKDVDDMTSSVNALAYATSLVGPPEPRLPLPTPDQDSPTLETFRVYPDSLKRQDEIGYRGKL